jgi:hypothetical protein
MEKMMDEIRVLAPTGMLGSGYLIESFNRGLKKNPHFIGVDAGSTDIGPYFLGAGVCSFSKAAYKRDLTPLLLSARRLKIPLAIGSAGTSGTEKQLQWTYEIIKEISREYDLHYKIAIIHAEQNKDYIISKLKEGKIKPLIPPLPIDEEVIRRSEHIVAMMGIEPYIQALSEGADVILAGRSSDPAIFASFCISKESDPGLAWHLAKILECGTAAVTLRKGPDSMIGYLHKDHFIVEPLDPDLKCTPQSIAAHSFYENYDPYYIHESSGTLDISKANYYANSDRTVKISGSKFIYRDPRTVKLEGAGFVGYQSIVIGSIRDPIIIHQIDDWIKRLKKKVEERIGDLYGDNITQNHINIFYHVYGKNGTMGTLEPIKETLSHELCLVIEVTAKTQEIASGVASSARHIALHLPVPQWSGLISGVAFPYSPAHLERGPVYRFNLNHIMEIEDSSEVFHLETTSI